MKLPLYDLLTAGRLLKPIGIYLGSEADSKLPAAVCDHYEIPEGRVVLTIWKDHLHSVIYQTPLDLADASKVRNAALFEHYGEGHGWRELLDNGFGKTYRRLDMRLFALWSYVMDYTTFGTLEYNDIGTKQGTTP